MDYLISTFADLVWSSVQVFAKTDGHPYLLARQYHTYPDNQSLDIPATK